MVHGHDFLNFRVLERVGALGVVCFFVFFPRFGDRFFSPIERAATTFARKKWLAIAAVAIVPILLRLALLPIAGPPIPHVHDEFSYLLAADTFAHGRLTNPPHPMWRFFDTFHVLQQPTYMSKYPPAQGAFLALGQLLGNPWIGVLLSIAIGYGACMWMLQGWLPPQWAFLGALFVMVRFDVMGYWANSYWGGFVALLGGALVLGALPRIKHGWRGRDAVILAVGIAILANSRPYEGCILCLPVAVAVLWWIRSPKAPSRTVIFRRLVAPVAAILIATFLFMGYYNWRGTGSARVFPYQVYEEQHDPIPIFVWGNFRPVTFENPQFEYFYGHLKTAQILNRMWDGRLQGPLRDVPATARELFSVGLVTLTVSLFCILVIIRDRRIRFLLIALAVCFAGFCVSVWLMPHYAAPVMPAIFALAIQVVRHFRRVWVLGRPAGIGMTRALVTGMLALGMVRIVVRAHLPDNSSLSHRAKIAHNLESQPGQDLVLVHYNSRHDPNDEWVYNRADIDHSKIVWAREIPGIDLGPLLDYFKQRTVWEVEADTSPPEIKKCDPVSTAQITKEPFGAITVCGQ